MVTVLVQFALPEGVSEAEVHDLFVASAPRFQTIPGLISKSYLYHGDRRTGGGTYLWESRDAAEAFFGADFRAMIREKYGVEPEITYFRTTVSVDNRSGEVYLAP